MKQIAMRFWRFMIDKSEQGQGYGQAALTEIIKYFRDNGADRLHLSTEPENEIGMHIYHKFGFRETGEINEDDALDWQMPFFEKHGYTVCGTLEDCPKGHRWCQLQKLL